MAWSGRVLVGVAWYVVDGIMGDGMVYCMVCGMISELSYDLLVHIAGA